MTIRCWHVVESGADSAFLVPEVRFCDRGEAVKFSPQSRNTLCWNCLRLRGQSPNLAQYRGYRCVVVYQVPDRWRKVWSRVKQFSEQPVIFGPFGGGKTITAHELSRRLPGSVICDPERVGYGMHRMLPPSLRSDFRELPPWRYSVRELLRQTLRSQSGPVIVPMTLTDSAHFNEIVGALRADGADVRHFALLAEPSTILKRVRERRWPLGLNNDRWAVDHLDQCLATLRQPEFAQHVHTDDRSVAEVAGAIAASAGLAIAPSADGPARDWLRRKATTVRHIRFG